MGIGLCGTYWEIILSYKYFFQGLNNYWIEWFWNTHSITVSVIHLYGRYWEQIQSFSFCCKIWIIAELLWNWCVWQILMNNDTTNVIFLSDVNHYDASLCENSMSQFSRKAKYNTCWNNSVKSPFPHNYLRCTEPWALK